MFLADKFIERTRPHSGGERRGFVGHSCIDVLAFEKIVHKLI